MVKYFNHCKAISFYVLLFASLFAVNCEAQIWEGKNAMFPYSNSGASVYAVDDSVAWVYGVEIDATGTETLNRNTISHTRDNGLTWSAVPLPIDTPSVLSSIHAEDYHTAWITYVEYPDGPQGAQGDNFVMYTDDSGLTWTPVNVPANEFINFIHMWNSLNGIVVGDPDTLGFEIHRTSDGGITWERIITGIGSLTNEYLYTDNYAVKGDQLWFASNKGRIFHTVDKGNTWVVYDSPSTLPGIGLMNVNDQGDVFMFYNTFSFKGYINTIFRRDAATGQWANVYERTSTYMYDIHPIPGSDAIISTKRVNSIYATQISYDNGANWLTINSGTKASFLGFYDADTGYASQVNTLSDTSQTLVYRYAGSPLTGLINHSPLQDVKISVSPNPTADDVNVIVMGRSTEDYWLLLNSLSGELIDKTTFESVLGFTYNLDLSKLPSGTYLLTVANKNGIQTEKIIRK